jgi:hypothetical protein
VVIDNYGGGQLIFFLTRSMGFSAIVDLLAATQMELDFKIFRMNYLGIPQERIALRLGQTREETL